MALFFEDMLIQYPNDIDPFNLKIGSFLAVSEQILATKLFDIKRDKPMIRGFKAKVFFKTSWGK